MKSDQKDSNKPTLIFKQSVPDYEKAELDLLRDALKRSYTERFDKMMQLIKMNIMLKNAKISRPD